LAGGAERIFHALVPTDTSTPRPVFVSLTGTEQEELAFAEQSALAELPDSGWIVLAPVRNCSQARTNCATTGSDGRVWEPWYDGVFPPNDEEGPDVRFVDAMVRCAAVEWPVDAKRVYVGGISAGGSFTNRNLTFNSELFAGGVPSSGNWYGGGAAPASAVTLEPMIAIVIWGGPDDVWPATNPLADYDPETRLAAQYYTAQPNLVTVACSGTHGHIWPTAMTPWLAQTLLSHPKGSPASRFQLTPPPAGFSCVLGPYTDH
jgi:poly(3-hydroxybutyrate) depolymerase